jgi:hypothetical protein
MDELLPTGATRPSPFLVEADLGQHCAQLHRDPGGLARSVAQFAETGLRREGRVVMFVTPATDEFVRKHLAAAELDVESLLRSGQLALIDADATLARLMIDGMPDWPATQRIFLEALDSSPVFGRGGTRAYGELANMLWRRGQKQAAIKLEEYLNVLAHYHPISMFCGHVIDSYDRRAYAGALQEIDRTHDHVLAGEEDERFRAALDEASRNVFGIPLTEVVKRNPTAAGQRLPLGQRTMLWILQHFPAKGAQLLDEARQSGERC